MGNVATSVCDASRNAIRATEDYNRIFTSDHEKILSNYKFDDKDAVDRATQFFAQFGKKYRNKEDRYASGLINIQWL